MPKIPKKRALEGGFFPREVGKSSPDLPIGPTAQQLSATSTCLVSTAPRPNCAEKRGQNAVLAEIEAGSKHVNQLASELSERIVAFEDWLNGLPGKVATTLWTDDGDVVDPYEFGLRLTRSGKRWELCCTSFPYGVDNDPCFDPDWTRLTESSVEIKLHSIKLFPQLLDRIVKEQKTLVQKLSEAHTEFDIFAAGLGLSRSNGGN